MTVEMITAFVTVLVLAAVVAVRSLSAGKIEIKLNDAIIAAIAATLTLLVSGRISKVVFGTEGLTVETAKQAILTASAQSITQQVASRGRAEGWPQRTPNTGEQAGASA